MVRQHTAKAYNKPKLIKVSIVASTMKVQNLNEKEAQNNEGQKTTAVSEQLNNGGNAVAPS